MSKIEWTSTTWNPIRGCSRVSEGCRNCYAERMAARFSGPRLEVGKKVPDSLAESLGPFAGFARATKAGPRWTGKVALIPEKLDEPLRWKRPRRVFVNSMSDLFHEALPDEAIDRVFAVMAQASRHTFQILTKRPERMRDYSAGMMALAPKDRTRRLVASMYRGHPSEYLVSGRVPDERVGDLAWPLPNVWLGVSVEDQPTADLRIPLLLQTPAAKRFVSYEPALAAVDFDGGIYDGPGWLRGWHTEPEHASGCDGSCSAGRCPEPVQTQNERLDQIIVGGESGPGARPCDVAWIRSTRDQCKAARVACFVKQMGHWIRGDHAGFIVDRWLVDGGRRVFVPPIIGEHTKDRPAGAIAFSIGGKGGEMECWPDDLRVREFPA